MKISREEVEEMIQAAGAKDTVRVIKFTRNNRVLYHATCGNFHIVNENLIESLWRLAEWLCTDGYDLRDITLEPELLEEE